MLHREYVLKRVKTWYEDRFNSQFSKLEDLDYFMTSDKVKEGLSQITFDNLHYTDIRDNTTYIRFSNFENLWLKTQVNSSIHFELVTYNKEMKEIVVLSEKEINHNLFYNLITKPYLKLHKWFKNQDEESTWKKREINYDILRMFLSDYHSLDIKTFKANRIIEMNIMKLKDYKEKYKFGKEKVLFFKALADDKYIHLLKNYSIFFGGFNNSYPDNLFLEVFEKYSIEQKHLDLLVGGQTTQILKGITDYTEMTFNYEKHKNSYYFDYLKKQIEVKNINAYFIFLRLSILEKIHELPKDLIDMLDDKILHEFDRLTTVILEIGTNPTLLYSFVYLNEYRQTIEMNGWNMDYENEDLKKILYSCIKMDYECIQNSRNQSLNQILLNLIQTSVFSGNSIQEIVKNVNRFHYAHNLKKIKLKNKLDNKLKLKNGNKKIEKI